MIKKVFGVSVVVCFCVGLVPMTAQGVQISPPSIEEVNNLKWSPMPAPRIGGFSARYEDPRTKTEWSFGATCKRNANSSDSLKELRDYPPLSITGILSLLTGIDDARRLNVNYSALNDWIVYASAPGPSSATVDSSKTFFVILDGDPVDPFGPVLPSPGFDPLETSALQSRPAVSAFGPIVEETEIESESE